MSKALTLRSLLFSLVLLVLSHGAMGQVSVSVSFGPPAIPVYDQPICPGDGYIWTPGYWDYDDGDGYYWVPGTWVEAPQPGYLWTPGYWGWGDNVYVFHRGYWGPHIGFYGGINYGYGYFGNGYEGGRWQNNHFYYNTEVNHVNETIIHNTYRTTIIENNRSRVSFNGGNGGIEARASAQEESYSREQHVDAVAAQREHVQQARGNPQLRASANQGRPPIAATAKAGDFRGGAVAARQAGGEYKVPPSNAAHGGQAANTPANGARPANDTRKATYNHASEVQAHQYTPPNTGNAKTDAKYQQQQQKLAAKQNQDHQKLQQQQEKQHQQLEKRSANDAQKQQMEQRHTQQTQQLEQKHTQQQTRMEQRQAPQQHENAPHGEGNHKP
jgi:hypothetical protein